MDEVQLLSTQLNIGPGLITGLIFLFAIIAIWELIWKGIALWKCGRNNQPAWFVFILILNTIGILPIIYLLFFQKKTKSVKNNKRRR
jgi:hypothetical protein